MTSRTLAAGYVTASGGTVVRPVWFAFLDFASPGPFRYNTSDRAFAFGGNTYTGKGEVVGFGEVAESADGREFGTTVLLTGAVGDHRTVAAAGNYQGRTAILYQGLVDAAGALIADPPVQFAGAIDYCRMLSGTERDVIEVVLRSPTSDWSRPRIRRRTTEEQERVYPGDLGLEFTKDMGEIVIQLGNG